MKTKIYRVFKFANIIERWEVKAKDKDEALLKVQASGEKPDDREYHDVEWSAETDGKL